MFNGKMKAVTFSYDDGVTQDIRLIEIFNKYGLKATFNLNSGRLGQTRELIREGVTVSQNKNKREDIMRIYKGHEVAGHTIDHENLTRLTDAEITKTVEGDRIALSEIVGYEVVGMAYPGAGVVYNEHVAKVIRETTGMKYARADDSTGGFELQPDLFLYNPTERQHNRFERLYRLAEEFINMKPDSPKLFYIWGHAYEFDINDSWDEMDRFCKFIAGHDDIFYGTNSEVLI